MTSYIAKRRGNTFHTLACQWTGGTLLDRGGGVCASILLPVGSSETTFHDNRISCAPHNFMETPANGKRTEKYHFILPKAGIETTDGLTLNHTATSKWPPTRLKPV